MIKIAIDETVVDIIVGLHAIFNDLEKVAAWMNAENLNLGGTTPTVLISIGKGNKVLEFVEDKCEEMYG